MLKLATLIGLTLADSGWTVLFLNVYRRLFVEAYFPLIQKLLVIGIWIYVGIQMCPAAQSRDRSPIGWYFIGLFAFYIPFAIIGFVPPALMLILMKYGMEITSRVFEGVGIAAFFSGVAVGFNCLHRAKLAAARPHSI